MKKALQKISIVSIGFLTPMFVFAQSQTSGIVRLLMDFQDLVNRVIPLLIGLALLAFMWGILMYLFGKNKDDGKTFMIWGIIALFVMTSVWGLVAIVRSTFIANPNSNQLQPQDIPRAPTLTR